MSDEETGQGGFVAAPLKPTISYDEFRSSTSGPAGSSWVEDVQGSDKLVRLTADFGDHKRTILVGLKQERANPSEIVGKQALFVVNLKPRTMMGELSEGMLFDIGYADHLTPVLAQPENPRTERSPRRIVEAVIRGPSQDAGHVRHAAASELA